MKKVRVLGPGCSKCVKLAENAREVINRHNLDVDFEYISETNEFLKYGVMITPALIVDNKVISVGRALSKKQLEKILL